jgi:hypothetical protein
MSTEHAEYINRCETAFNSFVDATPDFVNSESNCRNLVASLDRLGLTYDRASHLEIAYRSINSKKAAPAPAPEPLEAAIEREANRILAAGEIEHALQNLSAKQFEQKSYNLSFARALELREQRRVKSVLTRGDLAVAENLANKNGTSVASEISKSEKRMVAAQNPYPASPRTERSRGIENTHMMATYSTKRKPTLEAALAQERKDQKFLDEAATKTARLIRVKANKGK